MTKEEEIAVSQIITACSAAQPALAALSEAMEAICDCMIALRNGGVDMVALSRAQAAINIIHATPPDMFGKTICEAAAFLQKVWNR